MHANRDKSWTCAFGSESSASVHRDRGCPPCTPALPRCSIYPRFLPPFAPARKLSPSSFTSTEVYTSAHYSSQNKEQDHHPRELTCRLPPEDEDQRQNDLTSSSPTEAQNHDPPQLLSTEVYTSAHYSSPTENQDYRQPDLTSNSPTEAQHHDPLDLPST